MRGGQKCPVPAYSRVTIWMSIGISGMSKALCDYEGIGSALREANSLMEGISEATSGFTRSLNFMPTDDEVNYRSAAWQQAACTP